MDSGSSETAPEKRPTLEFRYTFDHKPTVSDIEKCRKAVFGLMRAVLKSQGIKAKLNELPLEYVDDGEDNVLRIKILL